MARQVTILLEVLVDIFGGLGDDGLDGGLDNDALVGGTAMTFKWL